MVSSAKCSLIISCSHFLTKRRVCACLMMSATRTVLRQRHWIHRLCQKY